jgi:MSHA biogenesis protein MshJ
MKQTWQKLAAKIDGLGLRERILIFLMAVVILVALINVTALDPQFSKVSELSQQIAQDQSQIAGIQGEIRSKVAAFESNPDATRAAQLVQLRQKAAQMRAALQDMQKGVVSPDRMAALLEDVLKQNGKLHLVSLRTIPVTGLNNASPDESKTSGDKTADKNAAELAAQKNEKHADGQFGSLVYKHGFEIVIEGNYLDLVDYMTALEGLPWQLFWGNAALSADESSKLSLTLTLYTLSLDKTWLHI